MADDEILNKLLAQRYQPVASAGLEARIIGRVQDYERSSGWFLVVYRGVCEALYLQRPGLVMAVIFVLGLVIGLYDEPAAHVSDGMVDELSSFMMVEDEFTAEDFFRGDVL